jgi:hypothetical protein
LALIAVTVHVALGLVELAHKRPVYASSEESNDLEDLSATNAVDGDPSTRWGSRFEEEASWIYVDLGADYTLSSVVVDWEAAYARKYQIQVSSNVNDGWTPVSPVIWGVPGNATTNLPQGTVARYVSVVCIQKSTVYGYSIYELYVFEALPTSTATSETSTTTTTLTTTATATTTTTTPLGVYKMTTESFRDFDNHQDACVSEFGAEAKVADWVDLRALGNESVQIILDDLGITASPTLVGFAGSWTGGSISDDLLTLTSPSGIVSDISTNEDTVILPLAGEVYYGQLTDDRNRIVWNDGDIWNRTQGSDVTAGESYIIGRGGSTCTAHGTYFFERHSGGPPPQWSNLSEIGEVYLMNWYLERAQVLCQTSGANATRDNRGSNSKKTFLGIDDGYVDSEVFPCVGYCHGPCADYTVEGACPAQCEWNGSAPSCQRATGVGEDSHFELTPSIYGPTVDHFAACTQKFGPGARVADWGDLEELGNESVSDLMDTLGISPTFHGSAYLVTWKGATCSADGIYFFERHNGDPPPEFQVLSTVGDINLGTYMISGQVLCLVPPAAAPDRLIDGGIGSTIAWTVGSVFAVATLFCLAYYLHRRRRKQEKPKPSVSVDGSIEASMCTNHQATAPAQRLSPAESRQLGINLGFVLRKLPLDAQQRAKRLVNEVLPQKADLSEDEHKFLETYGDGYQFGKQKSWASAIWTSTIWAPKELNVQDMTFIELSKVIAYGDVAYGKGKTCPRDGQLDCSIVDAVYPSGYSRKATLFLSWVWGYKFSVALSAVKNFSLTHPDITGKSCFIWWCFFQNNQFRMLGSGEKQSFDELREVFGTQLRNVGRMASMMDKVANSTYSKRLWCLFEVYVATEYKINVEVMLPREALLQTDMLLRQGGLDKLKTAIQIDAEKATASYPEDQEGIKALIEKMDGSYATLNACVRRSLKESVLAQVGRALGSGSKDNLGGSMDNLGGSAEDLGDGFEAEVTTI